MKRIHSRRNSCGLLWYSSFAAYLLMRTYLSAAAVRYSSSLLLHFSAEKEGLGKMSFHFFPAFFERSLKVREGTENQQMISITGVRFSFLWEAPVSKLMVCYFSVPTTKVSWRSMFCLYFSEFFLCHYNVKQSRNLGISNQDDPEDFY